MAAKVPPPAVTPEGGGAPDNGFERGSGFTADSGAVFDNGAEPDTGAVLGSGVVLDSGNSVPNRIQAVTELRLGRIIAAAIALLVTALIIYQIAINQTFRWDLVWLYLRDIVVFRGILWTLLLTFGSMALAIVMAVVLALMRRSDNPVLRTIGGAYVFLFRGTPIYVQLVLWGLLSVLWPRISVGLPFGPEWFSFSTQDLITAFWAALLGLACNEAAYLSEIVRAGLDSVDAGQSEAAYALGLTKWQTLSRVVLPQAMRVIVPPTGNETISMLKTTSLVVAIPFTLDLFYATSAIGNRLYQPIPLLLIAAFWYLVLSSVLMLGQHMLERKFGRGIAVSG
ncbi:MAG: amino acid ABC transporter permease [Cellulomonadaceae bacterium]|jgi:polar amino acid transport system permease protein|nr:amino acid ABC transporter permease [Cellulomonadaceae bacterium]